MTEEQLAALALAAVLVFWMVGAYNRLVMLRNVIAQAWAQVDDALRLRAAAAEPLLAALREPLAAEYGALDALRAAEAENARTAAAMGARPVVEANAAAWVAAEAAVAAAASRVFALFENNAALRTAEPVAVSAVRWREAQQRLGFSRQLYNDAAAAYNDAIAVFPTRLLLRLFGFGRAGRV